MESKKIILGTLKVFAAFFLAFTAVVAVAASKNDEPKETTITYYFDPVKEEWIKTVRSVPLQPNPDGTFPKPTNTLIIRAQQNNPIQEIIIVETVVVGGTDPLLEINGRDTSVPGSTGVLRIGTLTFRKVDAEELDIDDTDAVRITTTNAVAKDNELKIDVNIVNVVVVGRGAASSLFLGASRTDIFKILDLTADTDFTLNQNIVAPSQIGMRVDRIRILGPDSGTGHIERLTVQNTSVFGEIQVRNVKVQDIILKDVSLDDDLTP
ncbi:MAG: hypothetical protein HY667_01485 [Chloroflexi bacterium]|nr:hypothetical protein [Chloroflexota bacterium]